MCPVQLEQFCADRRRCRAHEGLLHPSSRGPPPPVIARGAATKRSPAPGTLDGFVVALLAMTGGVGDSSHRKDALVPPPATLGDAEQRFVSHVWRHSEHPSHRFNVGHHCTYGKLVVTQRWSAHTGGDGQLDAHPNPILHPNSEDMLVCAGDNVNSDSAPSQGNRVKQGQACTSGGGGRCPETRRVAPCRSRRMRFLVASVRNPHHIC